MAEVKPPFEASAHDEPKEPTGNVYGRTVTKKSNFDPAKYNTSDRFDPDGYTDHPRTTLELVHHLEKNEKAEIDARVICKEADGRMNRRSFDRKGFLEHWNAFSEKVSLKEFDSFASDGGGGSPTGGTTGLPLGVDYVPMLSGPFYKQLYYQDYLQMHALAFQAYHHDAVAKRCINIIKEFTIGRGFAVDFEDQEEQTLWEGFAEANNLEERFDNFVLELLLFGELLIWWLPNNDINIGWQLQPGQEVKKGIIPRIRTIDPSVIWEIVTYPEDIERVLFYQWVAPTQYQIYTGSSGGKPVPGMKWIFQQIPAAEVMHFKINCVSGEKRGRSILFPVLGDLKRHRDTIDFLIAREQKNAAWAIDTTVEGNQVDIDGYVSAQAQLGTIPTAGSEFVHTKAITRTYLNNSGTGGTGQNDTVTAVLSKIAMGIGVPVNYLGGQSAAGSNRASALVATEPVTKTFEYYQKMYERIIRTMAKRLGCKSRMEVTFPELVTQDRSAKIRDIQASERSGYISPSRAATMAAKELSITDYNYETEQEAIHKEGPINPNLLTDPGLVSKDGMDAPSGGQEIGQREEPGANKPSMVTGDEKRKISMGYGA